MTRCHCPPRMCYFRPDCRKIARGFKPPPQPTPIAAARLMWLEEQHDRLVDEMQGKLTWTQRKNMAAALMAIDAAIERHSS